MLKQKAVLLIILYCGFQDKSFSQINTEKMVKNLIYLEAFGTGGYGSVNYERVLFHQKNKQYPKLNVGLRVGVSTLHLRDFEGKFNPDLIFPVSINAFYGKIHHLEVGLGQTISNVVQTNTSTFTIERKTTLSSNFTVGYRYQKNKRGPIFRLNYSPIISTNKVYNNWFGLSVGYGF
ncbi:hypothetical protein EMA8858_00762 [Emticicia aquatica]|uniref:Outer membrane protein beta-barrel domain-containing protein n=1 Tax=Emticicia aquatica TaxID=1681835 RepID=A0ABM9AM08_9BACT|nr:hypothetical protein [Emticicia aquatica]CAH0994650.1 hypothetical protein EMA8858_00762 [Emticicia aquatica]